MKDIFGTEFKPGDIIMYPVRYGSGMWMKIGLVKELGKKKDYWSKELVEYCKIEKACNSFMSFDSEEEIPEDLKHLGFKRNSYMQEWDYDTGKKLDPARECVYWSGHKPYWKICNFSSSCRSTVLTEEQINTVISNGEKGEFFDIKKYKERRTKWQK